MNATNRAGHEWNDERQDGYWIYTDAQGNLYESAEVPAYRIVMDKAHVVMVDGQPTICPL